MTGTGEETPRGEALQWHPSYCTGLEQVDEEHRHLFGLLATLRLDNVHTALAELLHYVRTHFAREQALMQQSGYPELSLHVMLHEQLATPLQEFAAERTHWTEQRLQRLRVYLHQWLVGHILTHDLHFGDWLREQRRTPPAPPAPPPRLRWLQRLLGGT